MYYISFSLSDPSCAVSHPRNGKMHRMIRPIHGTHLMLIGEIIQFSFNSYFILYYNLSFAFYFMINDVTALKHLLLPNLSLQTLFIVVLKTSLSNLLLKCKVLLSYSNKFYFFLITYI